MQLPKIDRRASVIGTGIEDRGLFKDQILDELADVANVAQFVSFSPQLEQRYSRVREFVPNHPFPSLPVAAGILLERSPEKSVNIRSFDPITPESREFVYGLRAVDDIVENGKRIAQQGFYTIINETVDVNDGGISGVLLGDVVEFAPGDTPRTVEKPGVASLPRDLGLRLLKAVYGFEPDLGYPLNRRVEFSLHPIRRGVRFDHTIVWQVEDVGVHPNEAALVWPNRFSKFVGDKAFGLLIANLLGAAVPRTRVVPRWLPPFEFGRSTGTGETWTRTCPTVQQPGKFTTAPKWIDPFALMQSEDPSGTEIASVLAQEGVDPHFSGALVIGRDDKVIVEGVPGRGDDFMIGKQGPADLPERVKQDIVKIASTLGKTLGALRMEWVHDGSRAWVVQLHRGAIESEGRTIVPGEATHYQRFEVERGIEAFRTVVAEAKTSGDGVILVGNVGITSHFGDILRKAQVVSRIEAPLGCHDSVEDGIAPPLSGR
jgi:hypothetical protein